MFLYRMKKITKNFNLEITKHNYKAFGIINRKAFLKFKRRVLKDLQNNPLSLNENYNPVSSSIWNPINMSYQSGKSNNARYNNK